jgi:hypothetical protein
MKTPQPHHQAQPPSFWRILDTDYATWVCLATPIALWVVYLILKLIRQTYTDEPLYLSISAGATVIGILITLYRYFTTLNILNRGVPVKGKITRVQLFRGAGQIAYEFKHQGSKHQASIMYHRGRKSVRFTQGMPVIVLVDPDNPRKTLVKEMYYI